MVMLNVATSSSTRPRPQALREKVTPVHVPQQLHCPAAVGSSAKASTADKLNLRGAIYRPQHMVSARAANLLQRGGRS